jgi:hypothetical protein
MWLFHIHTFLMEEKKNRGKTKKCSKATYFALSLAVVLTSR